MARDLQRPGLIKVVITLRNSTEIVLYVHPDVLTTKLENYLSLPVLILQDQDPYSPLNLTAIITTSDISLITLSESKKQ